MYSEYIALSKTIYKYSRIDNRNFLQPLKVEVYLKNLPYSTTDRCRVHFQNLKENLITRFCEAYSLRKCNTNYSYRTNLKKK